MAGVVELFHHLAPPLYQKETQDDAMKGFYITIKNGLLDPKHFKAMGGDKGSGAVWLFLWLLDKMTIIDEEKGEGKVLGGRPVKFEEIEKELGISRTTYVEWTKLLRQSNYIKTTRTPYGLAFVVYKAFKVFGQKSDRRVATPSSEKERSTSTPSSVCGGHRSSNYNKTVNKTILVSKDTKLDKPTKVVPIFSYKSYLSTLIASKKKNLHIIGLYWQYKDFAFENRLQCSSALKRELRPAKSLTGYSDEDIVATMDWLCDNVSFKWVLETVHKFIDEDLDGLETFNKKKQY